MTSLIPPGCPAVLTEDDRTGTSIETLRRAFMDNLFFIQGRFPEVATKNDYYLALAYTVRDRLLLRWLNSAKTYRDQESRTVCYLSAEFLLGPHLGNNLVNLGLYEAVEEAVRQTGLNLEELLNQEEEPGLGNGGLGRLAACYMDSLARWKFPPLATAFATNMASLTKKFAMVGKLRLRISGYATATLGKFPVQS